MSLEANPPEQAPAKPGKLSRTWKTLTIVGGAIVGTTTVISTLFQIYTGWEDRQEKEAAKEAAKKAIANQTSASEIAPKPLPSPSAPRGPAEPSPPPAATTAPEALAKPATQPPPPSADARLSAQPVERPASAPTQTPIVVALPPSPPAPEIARPPVSASAPPVAIEPPVTPPFVAVRPRPAPAVPDTGRSKPVTLNLGDSADLCGVSLRLGRSELSSAGYRLIQRGVLPSEQRMFDIGPRQSIAVTQDCRVRVVGMEAFAGGTMMVVTLEEERKP